MKIKVENNLKEILQVLEDFGYVWLTGNKPTKLNLTKQATYIKTNGNKKLEWGANEVTDTVTLTEFISKTTMNRNNILVGYKLTLENRNSFEVLRYKDEKILFPVGSSVSTISLNELCNHDLSPINKASRIMRIENSLGIIMWERKFTRSDIKPGYILTNDTGTKYLVVSDIFEGLRIIPMCQYTIGACLNEIMKEDMSPLTPSHSEIIEVKDTTGKVVYSK